MHSRTVFVIGVLCGIFASASLREVYLRAETPPATQPSNSGDAHAAKQSPTYVNSYRVRTLTDGIVIELGLNSPRPEASDAGKMQFDVTDRVLMSYYMMKRLQTSLGLVVKRYEERFGPIQPPPGAH